jgi:hypothetical protein
MTSYLRSARDYFFGSKPKDVVDQPKRSATSIPGATVGARPALGALDEKFEATTVDPSRSASNPSQPTVDSSMPGPNMTVFPIPDESTATSEYKRDISFDQLVTGVPSQLERQVVQLNRIWASSADKTIFKPGNDVPEAKQPIVTAYQSNMVALTNLLDSRVTQFQAAIAAEAKARLDSDIRRDPRGLMRLLNGVREFATLVATLAPDEVLVATSTGTSTMNKADFVDKWNRLVENMTALVGEASSCPETIYPGGSTILGHVVTAASEERKSTLFGTEGLTTIRDRIVQFFLKIYQRPEYNEKRFLTAYGVGQTGKSLIGREAINALAIAMRDFAISKRGPAASIPDAKTWDLSQFLRLKMADANAIRFDDNRGEERTPRQVIEKITEWLDCAQMEAQANSAFFASKRVGIRCRTMLMIKNLDNLFVDDKTILTSGERPTQSFALETAARVWVANTQVEQEIPVAENGTRISYPLLGDVALPPGAVPTAPLQTPSAPPEVDISLPIPQAVASAPPSNGVTAQNSIQAVGPGAPSAAPIKPAGPTGAALGGAARRAGKVKLGSPEQRSELERGLLHLLRSDHMRQKYPDVWVLFTMRVPYYIPKPLRTLIDSDSVRIDLPSDNLRRAILKTEWRRQYTNSIVERVHRMIQIFEDARPTELKESNGQLQVKFQFPERITPFFNQIVKVFKSAPAGQWGLFLEKHKNEIYVLEHWLVGYFFYLYQRTSVKYPNVGNATVLNQTTDDSKRQRIRNQIDSILRYEYDTKDIPTEDLLVRDLYVKIRESLFNTLMERTGLLDRLVAFTGMGQAGRCALLEVGIPETYLTRYLQATGRQTTGGKWMFGLNLEQMYQFIQALEQESQRFYLQKAVDESKRYMNQDIYAPGCSNTARLVRPVTIGDETSGWKLESSVPSTDSKQPVTQSLAPFPYESTRLPAAVTGLAATPQGKIITPSRPSSSGPVVQYEQSTCEGSIDLLDLPIITTNIDYAWTDVIVNQVISKIKSAKLFPTNAGYLDFVREFFFENPRARGITPPQVPAKCRTMQAEQDQREIRRGEARERQERQVEEGLRPSGTLLSRPPGITGTVRPLSLKGTVKSFGGQNEREDNKSLNVLVEPRVAGRTIKKTSDVHSKKNQGRNVLVSAGGVTKPSVTLKTKSKKLSDVIDY